MKSKFIKGLFLASTMTLMFACNSKKEEPAAVVIDKEQIKQEIQNRENEFAEIYNTGELKDIGYYAEDAISYSQNKAPLVGRKAIVEYWLANMDSANKSFKISFTTLEVYVTNEGNQVLEIGSYKLVDAASATVNSGNYMSLFEKRDGKYVSIRDMSTSDMPLE